MNKKTTKHILLLLLFVLLLLLSLRPPTDPDLGWHLKTGELIWNFGIPYNDPYSFTMPADFVWVNKEWGIELLMYGIQKQFSTIGLSIFFALLVAGTFGYLIQKTTFYPPTTLAVITVFFLSLAASWTFIGIRPQMIALLFFAVILAILRKLYHNPLSKSIYLIPVILLLWVNLHGSFILGYGVLFIIIVVEAIKFSMNCEERLSAISHASLITVFVISILLIPVNPYGVSILEDLKNNLVENNTLTYVKEWQSPDFQSPEGMIFMLVIFLLLAILYFSDKKPNPTHFTLAILMMFLALSSRRHIPLFMVAVSPILLEQISWHVPDITGMKAKAVAVSLVVAIILLAIPTVQSIQPIQKSDAISFLNSQPNNTRIFNDYGLGGYVIYNSDCAKLAPHNISCSPKVFIDGRMSYWQSYNGRMILSDYVTVINGDNLDLLREYNITTVLLDKTNNNVFIHVISLLPEWKLEYEDNRFEVWILRG